jgi:hypothetical protein
MLVGLFCFFVFVLVFFFFCYFFIIILFYFILFYFLFCFCFICFVVILLCFLAVSTTLPGNQIGDLNDGIVFSFRENSFPSCTFNIFYKPVSMLLSHFHPSFIPLSSLFHPSFISLSSIFHPSFIHLYPFILLSSLLLLTPLIPKLRMR